MPRPKLLEPREETVGVTVTRSVKEELSQYAQAREVTLSTAAYEILKGFFVQQDHLEKGGRATEGHVQ